MLLCLDLFLSFYSLLFVSCLVQDFFFNTNKKTQDDHNAVLRKHSKDILGTEANALQYLYENILNMVLYNEKEKKNNFETPTPTF